jgi:hypothetical protein
VLEETIRNGVNSDQYFALAEGYADGRYMGLKYNTLVVLLDPHYYVVRLEAALKQIAAGVGTAGPTSGGPAVGIPAGTPSTCGQETLVSVTPIPPNPGNGTPQASNRTFVLSARLDNTRINRDVSRLVDEVINLLTQMDGCDVNVSLEVNAAVDKGIPFDTVRALSENCRALRVSDFEFRK